jgi:hypothetical protein
MIFGDIYEEIHSYKDQPAQWLGRWHRRERHEWYQRFPSDWDLEHPYPDLLRSEFERVLVERGPDSAEIEQVRATHDPFDRLWDAWDHSHRRNVANALARIMRHPELLRSRYGIDVFAERVQRRIAGTDIWESAPGLEPKWLKLLGKPSIKSE